MNDAPAPAHVTLLDGVSVRGPGGVATAEQLAGPQPRTTFAYLVMHRDVSVPIDHLGEIVWGSERPETWRPALRALVAKARAFIATAVPDASVAMEHGGYHLAMPGPVTVDIEQAHHCGRLAEQALQASQVEDAVAHAAQADQLARGGFLPRSSSQWAAQAAQDLRDLRVRALHVLGEAHILRDEPQRAIRSAREAIALAPLHEASHRLAMRALVAAGETAEAALAFARCREVLGDELGVRPSRQTTELFTSILRE